MKMRRCVRRTETAFAPIRVGTFTLLALALAPVCYLFSFHFQQQRIRHRMEEELVCGKLQQVTLQRNDLHWNRVGKEIIVDGKLFDVKAITYNKNGDAIVTGLFDNDETVLVREFQKNQKENNSQGTRQLAQFFQLMLVMPEYPQENISFTVLLNSTRFPGIESNPVAAFMAILTPPPQA